MRPAVFESCLVPIRLRVGLRLCLIAALCSACGRAVAFDDRITVVGLPAAVRPAKPRAELREDHIVIREAVQFAADDDRILPASFDLLDDVGEIMNENPHIRRIEISEPAAANCSSDRRVEAVRNYLIENSGVSPERIATRGCRLPPAQSQAVGEPLDGDASIEFSILEQDAVKVRVGADPHPRPPTDPEPVLPLREKESRPEP